MWGGGGNYVVVPVGAREMTKMANHSMLYSVCVGGGGGGGIMLLCLWVQEVKWNRGGSLTNN